MNETVYLRVELIYVLELENLIGKYRDALFLEETIMGEKQENDIIKR